MAGLNSSNLCWLLVSGVLWFPAVARAECPADLTNNRVVDAGDLALLLGAWGPCAGCTADINGDDFVGAFDLALLLGAWGCCPIPTEPSMVLVPGGEFEMGCHDDPLGCRARELPVHAVFVSTFYMSVYEVTNQQYTDYLNSAYAQGLIEVSGGVVYKAGDSEPYCDTNSASPYSRIHWDGSTFTITVCKEDHPMLEVSWYGAAAYGNWISVQDGLQPCYDLETWACDFAQDGYRLPTEAEWEHAGRGGLHDPYYQFPWGNDLDGSKANYSQSGDPFGGPSPRTSPVGYYDGGQTPVGVDMANGYGLYDMTGNVREWCNDWMSYTYYQSSPYDNPQGPASGGSGRVFRGGAWDDHIVGNLRCATRESSQPDLRLRETGFRVAARP